MGCSTRCVAQVLTHGSLFQELQGNLPWQCKDARLGLLDCPKADLVYDGTGRCSQCPTGCRAEMGKAFPTASDTSSEGMWTQPSPPPSFVEASVHSFSAVL